MIQDSRIHFLNDTPPINDNRYVLYWMQSSHRTRCNHALEYALREANRLQKPLLVYLGVTAAYPEANLRHFQFMLEGLQAVAENLARRQIPFLVEPISPEAGALKLSDRAVLIVVDKGYQRHERDWRKTVAENAPCQVVEVETNVMVPVAAASPKEEYSAATLRRKIERLIPEYSLPLSETPLHRSDLPGDLALRLTGSRELAELFAKLPLDTSVPPVSRYFRGGEAVAEELLEQFLDHGLTGYATERNDPAYGVTSNLSPYLHFGQLSPLEIYLKLLDTHSEDKRSFLDELIVRRELAVNFVYYNPNYDTYDAITSFARETLDRHAQDIRLPLYELSELEAGATYDPYWNAAQQEMVQTGKMNGYMRMYWGKKVIEWSPSPAEAYRRLVYLNNKYSLDGRDHNGYAGIAWCFGKHDRAWAERPIFGKVRYMNDKGLQRKFRIDDYVAKVNQLTTETP